MWANVCVCRQNESLESTWVSLPLPYIVPCFIHTVRHFIQRIKHFYFMFRSTRIRPNCVYINSDDLLHSEVPREIYEIARKNTNKRSWREFRWHVSCCFIDVPSTHFENWNAHNAVWRFINRKRWARWLEKDISLFHAGAVFLTLAVSFVLPLPSFFLSRRQTIATFLFVPELAWHFLKTRR